ncbi:MAG: hypothetical protein K8H90_00015, partial [Thermoanaerobaculia bacterium]|nr:hypothetical protein [Thermoanaerobaculia bacterium]
PGNVARFGPERIHNPSNVAPLPHGRGSIHAKLSGFYSSKQPSVTGSPSLTVRQWLATKPFSEQYQFGLEAMQRFGGGGSPMEVSSATRSWAWPAVLEPFSESYSPADFFGQDEETP